MGFPAVIIDRPVIDPSIKSVADLEKKQALFNQYVGVPVYISHSMDQNTGGSTQINCQYARTHRGRDDEYLRSAKGFMGVDLSKTEKITLNYHALVAAGDAKGLTVLFNLTRQTGDSSTRKQNMLGTVINSPASPGSIGVNSMGVKNTILAIDVIESSAAGGTGDALLENTHLTSLLSQSVIKVDEDLIVNVLLPAIDAQLPIPVYETVILYELKQDTKVEDIQMPVEEVIRPIWISKIYRNPEIGSAVYMPLLGVSSITDQNFAGTGIPSVKFDGKEFYSVERAVDYLTYRYSSKRVCGDTNSFVEEYTKRPIATLRQILGSPDGKDVGMYSKSFRGDESMVELTKTSIRSVDLYDTQCTPASPHDPPAYLDTRKEKFDRVWRYRSSLSGRGLSG